MKRFLISLVLVLFACDGDKPEPDTAEEELPPLEPGFEDGLVDWGLHITTQYDEFHVWSVYARAQDVRLIVGMRGTDEDVSSPGAYSYSADEFVVLVDRGIDAHECRFGCSDSTCGPNPQDEYRSSGGEAELVVNEDDAEIYIRDILLEPSDLEGEALPVDAIEVTGMPIYHCEQREGCTF